MGDVQDRFVKTITLETKFTLLLEHLRGARLRVDPAEQASRPVNWRGPATCASIRVRDNTRAGGPFSAGRGTSASVTTIKFQPSPRSITIV
jgi:hypothetical protein